MRVALDATYSVDSQPSGIAVYSRNILDGLAVQYPSDSFVHCFRPGQFRRRPRGMVASNAEQRCLLPILPTFRADLFHALNQRLDRRPASRTVTTFHDLFVMTGEYSSPEFRQRFTGQARRAAENSDFVIAISAFTAGQVSDLLNVPPSRIRVIPHGVDRMKLAGSRPRERIILFVGALQIRKNIMRLVEAFETLPPAWRLVLAGSRNGYKAEEILSRIEESPRRSDITITGYIDRERLEDLFHRASVMAFPSLDEGFGIPVLEAMAAGIPVLTSDGSALREIASGAAVLVDPWHTESIAEGLRRLTQDEDLRKSLTTAGYARAARYSWQASLQATYDVYRELVG